MMSSAERDPAIRSSVLVTGGSRGLGRCFVTAFASAGYDVYFTYQHNHDHSAALVDELRGNGGRVTAMELDVRDEHQVRRVVADAEQQSGGLGVLVNNAGVSHDGMSWKVEPAKWRDTLDTNLTGAFLMTQAALPGMRERRHGRIINISSVVGRRGVAGTAAYSASKAALFGMTRTIAREVASRNVTVNCLVLGYYNAGMGTKLPEDILEQTIQAIPAGRLGNPEELATIVLFLCSDACSYLTGQEIVIDGGFLIA